MSATTVSYKDLQKAFRENNLNATTASSIGVSRKEADLVEALRRDTKLPHTSFNVFMRTVGMKDALGEHTLIAYDELF